MEHGAPQGVLKLAGRHTPCMKAMPQGGAVAISSRCHQGVVKLVSELPKVFQIKHSQPRQLITELRHRRLSAQLLQAQQARVRTGPVRDQFDELELLFPQHHQAGAVRITHSRATFAGRLKELRPTLGQVGHLEDHI